LFLNFRPSFKAGIRKYTKELYSAISYWHHSIYVLFAESW